MAIAGRAFNCSPIGDPVCDRGWEVVVGLAGKGVTVGPAEGERVAFPSFAVTFKIEGADTGGAFSVVEYEVQPRTLIFPHVHSREDETSYVIAGEIGVRVGDHEQLLAEGGYAESRGWFRTRSGTPPTGLRACLRLSPRPGSKPTSGKRLLSSTSPVSRISR
jgi:quercetin dioxygenase-like cupin family protein